MSTHFTKLCCAMGLGLLCWACGGCGTGSYEQRLNARVRELREGAAPKLVEVNVPGAPVSLVLPPELGQPLKSGKKAAANRLQPPVAIFDGADLPDLKATFEAAIPDAQKGKQHFYCYVGVTNKSKLANAETAIRAKIQEKFAGKAAWESVPCPSTGGENVQCRKLHTIAQQDFYYVDEKGKGDFRPMDGTLDVYLREEGGYLVAIVWRVPTGLLAYVGPNQEGLDKVAAQTAGSVAVK